jgi:hypothetical protein
VVILHGPGSGAKEGASRPAPRLGAPSVLPQTSIVCFVAGHSRDEGSPEPRGLRAPPAWPSESGSNSSAVAVTQAASAALSSTLEPEPRFTKAHGTASDFKRGPLKNLAERLTPSDSNTISRKSGSKLVIRASAVRAAVRNRAWRSLSTCLAIPNQPARKRRGIQAPPTVRE